VLDLGRKFSRAPGKPETYTAPRAPRRRTPRINLLHSHKRHRVSSDSCSWQQDAKDRVPAARTAPASLTLTPP
jgi:hypothetical protein